VVGKEPGTAELGWALQLVQIWPAAAEKEPGAAEQDWLQVVQIWPTAAAFEHERLQGREHASIRFRPAFPLVPLVLSPCTGRR
jgi:hypothetical protein